MNGSMVNHLIRKDWYFNRIPIIFYLVVGVVALALTAVDNTTTFYVGSLLLIVVLLTAGIHIVMATVIYERKEQTLPFVMSLPVSFMEYTTAKILANLTTFLLPWGMLILGTWLVIKNSAGIPNGLIPFAVLVLLQILVGYCLMLSLALVTESETWTIIVLVLSNLFLNYFMYTVSHIPAMEAAMLGETIIWNQEAILILLAQIIVILLAIGLTFYFQSRKKDFL